MILVKKTEFAGDQAWADLVTQASAARASLIDSFDADQEIRVDDKLYKKYMAYLLRLFHHKCAYCETVIGDNQPGDVEHYRPKGRVVGDDLKPVQVQHPVKGAIQHPGYYWLAYDWSNLFPSCIDCNRARRHGVAKELAGKADRFPVEGQYAFIPGKEAEEKALLINPSLVDPADHLEFKPDGTVKGKTPIGERTIKELGLNLREPLVEQRRLAFRDARRLGNDYVESWVNERQAEIEDLQPDLDKIRAGSVAFAAVRRLSYDMVVEGYKKRLAALAGGPPG